MFEPANARPGRRKIFGTGRQSSIDRNDRARVMLLADASRRRGNITIAAVDVIRALLYKFANLKDGRCIPSHARLAEAAGCCERTVGRCLQALEEVGLVAWVHRIRRIKESSGALVSTWRVERTSNSYDFPPRRTSCCEGFCPAAPIAETPPRASRWACAAERNRKAA
jgi:hypothetical protein